MEFKYAKTCDRDEIMELYHRAIGTEGCTWNDNYPGEATFLKDTEHEDLLCLTDAGKIIACISYDMDEEVENLPIWRDKKGNARELSRLVVAKDYRNRGIARQMILKAMEELKKRGYKAVHFLVSPDNMRAVNSYEKLKFNKAGEADLLDKHWYCYEKSLFAVEKSITKTYGAVIWRPFIEAVAKYKLIDDGDKIAVCISGGKDSMLLAKLLLMAKEYGIYNISLEFVMMDSGYREKDLETVLWNARLLGVPITVFKSDVFAATEDIGSNPCFFCSRMRRGYLYRKAKELGCNKIALGHHYNDVIETILMGMLYGAQIQTMLPILDSDNVKGMKLIRPMYLIHEKDILEWKKENRLDFVKCACNLKTDGGEEDTTRLKVKKLIEKLAEENPAVEANIFGSVMNVDLNKVLSYKQPQK